MCDSGCLGRDGRVRGIRDRGGISAHWRRAPFVLRHHVSILVAVLAAAVLVGLTASSAPFLSTAAGSAALKNRLNELDPLTTGVEIQRDGGATRTESATEVQKRLDAGVAKIATRVGSLGSPIKTLELADSSATDANGNGFAEIAVMTRTGVFDHVKVLRRVPGPGLVIADTTAKALHVRPGGTIRMQTLVGERAVANSAGPRRRHLSGARVRAGGAVLGQLRGEHLSGQPRCSGADAVRLCDPR